MKLLLSERNSQPHVFPHCVCVVCVCAAYMTTTRMTKSQGMREKTTVGSNDDENAGRKKPAIPLPASQE